jgi:hypothetical protein
MKKFSHYLDERVKLDSQKQYDIKEFAKALVDDYGFTQEQAMEEYYRLTTCKSLDDYIRLDRKGASKKLNRSERKEIWNHHYSILFTLYESQEQINEMFDVEEAKEVVKKYISKFKGAKYFDAIARHADIFFDVPKSKISIHVSHGIVEITTPDMIGKEYQKTHFKILDEIHDFMDDIRAYAKAMYKVKGR